MHTFANPFPWWLWILAGLWIGSILIRLGLHSRSEWKRWLDLWIVCYAALLLYMTLQSSRSESWGFEAGVLPLLAVVAAVCTVVGGLGMIGACSVFDARWSSRVTCLGMAGLAAGLKAYELSVIGVMACGLVGWAEQSHRETKSQAMPQVNRMLIGIAAVSLSVVWLGLLQFATRVELHRPGPSRWFTVIPNVEAVLRARQMTGTTDSSPSIAATHLILAAATWLLMGLGQRPPSHRTHQVDDMEGLPCKGS